MPPSRDEVGETLIEIVIAIVILGIAIVALIGAVSTGATLSLGHRHLTDADVALKRTVEYVKALKYQAGATNLTYSVTGLSLPAGLTPTVTVKCLTPTTADQALTSAVACTTNAQEIQVITVQITGSDTSVSSTFAKRNS